MRELPKNQLDERVKAVWRISDAITIAVCFLPVVALLLWIGLSERITGVVIAGAIVLGCALVLMAVFVGVLPGIRFARWRYELTDDYVDIAKGIIWRQRTMIPFIRVQNTDTKQGPIMRAFGLASVTVSTAAGEHVIPGLAVDEAEELRDRAAELARIAREDV